MESMLTKITISFLYLLGAFITNLIVKKISGVLFFGIKRTSNDNLIKKTKTLKTFFEALLTVVIFFIFIFLILDFWGVNLLPFATGAGVLGLALSFGSQTLVKDLISGFFIIFDNQFNVGDQVKIGNYQGKVKKISLRQTILKDENDNLIIIPNSQISTVVKLKPKTD